MPGAVLDPREWSSEKPKRINKNPTPVAPTFSCSSPLTDCLIAHDGDVTGVSEPIPCGWAGGLLPNVGSDEYPLKIAESLCDIAITYFLKGGDLRTKQPSREINKYLYMLWMSTSKLPSTRNCTNVDFGWQGRRVHRGTVFRLKWRAAPGWLRRLSSCLGFRS